MKVLFDLRPKNIVMMQKTKISIFRLLVMLLFGACAFIAIFSMIFMGVRLSEINDEMAAMERENSRVTEDSFRIASTLGTMRQLRDTVRSYLDFAKQELPTVEFLSFLEGSVPRGLKITNIEIRQNGVAMRGTALTDQDIIDFAANLGRMTSLVTKVDVPVTTHTQAPNGRNMLSQFSLTCSLRPMSEIAEEHDLLISGGGAAGEAGAGR